MITVGTITPSFACACVAALNSLQKSMMLTPAAPKAGPIGGAGFAFPAGICSLIILETFGHDWLLLFNDYCLSALVGACRTCVNFKSTLFVRPNIIHTNGNLLFFIDLLNAILS